MTGPTVYVVRNGRHPVVVTILVGLLVVAVYSLVHAPPSATLDLAFGHPERLLWSTLVAAGSAATLWGLYHRAPVYGLRIERVGWGMTSVGTAVYAVILIDLTGWTSAGVLLAFVVGVAVGGAWRIAQITRDLRALAHG